MLRLVPIYQEGLVQIIFCGPSPLLYWATAVRSSLIYSVYTLCHGASTVCSLTEAEEEWNQQLLSFQPCLDVTTQHVPECHAAGYCAQSLLWIWPCSSVAQVCGGLGLFYGESLVCVGESLGVVVRIVSHPLFDVTLYLAKGYTHIHIQRHCMIKPQMSPLAIKSTTGATYPDFQSLVQRKIQIQNHFWLTPCYPASVYHSPLPVWCMLPVALASPALSAGCLLPWQAGLQQCERLDSLRLTGTGVVLRTDSSKERKHYLRLTTASHKEQFDIPGNTQTRRTKVSLPVTSVTNMITPVVFNEGEFHKHVNKIIIKPRIFLSVNLAPWWWWTVSTSRKPECDTWQRWRGNKSISSYWTSAPTQLQ